MTSKFILADKSFLYSVKIRKEVVEIIVNISIELLISI